MTVKELCSIINERIETKHIGCFEGMDKPLFLISTAYPGVWLEHVYDSVFYAKLNPERLNLAENTVELFISLQKENGQLPCYVLDPSKSAGYSTNIGYSQTQECVSFAKLCFEVFKMNRSREFLEKVYSSCVSWVGWLQRFRMTRGEGLVEMFVGYDTGHDNSGRLNGMAYKGNYSRDAGELPPDDGVTPIIAVDMNCTYYATLTTLSAMAFELGYSEASVEWTKQADAVKKRLIELCWDKDDSFFYDVDKNGCKRKYLSSTVFHLFMESVLDPKNDADIICALWEKHITNPNEFATPYPYPGMAICDPSCEGHINANCWGYYSQGNIALRTTFWMEQYGFIKEYDYICSQWVKAWTEHYDTVKFGQELDPITGIPTKASQWYSTTMLFYLHSARRLGYLS